MNVCLVVMLNGQGCCCDVGKQSVCIVRPVAMTRSVYA